MPDRLLLITGATGLVGSHVAESAAPAGWRVRALVRAGSPGTALLHGLGIETVPGDLADAASIRAAMAGVSHVVHCAAAVGDWGAAATYRRLNVDATETLVDAAAQNPRLERLVYLSSLGVYPPRHHHGTTEDAPLDGAGLDPYTRTKAAAEAVVRAAAAGRRVPAVIVRPGFVYGPRDRQVLPPLADALLRRRFVWLGDGRRMMDQVNVRNLVQAIGLCLERPEAVGKIYNVTDDPPVDRREFVGTVARLLDVPIPPASLPLWAAYPLAWTLDHAGRVLRLRRPPPLTMARYKFLALNLHFSIDRIRRELGYRPRVTFEAGMKEAVAWWTGHSGHPLAGKGHAA